jgi:hypothetical protein
VRALRRHAQLGKVYGNVKATACDLERFQIMLDENRRKPAPC